MYPTLSLFSICLLGLKVLANPVSQRAANSSTPISDLLPVTVIDTEGNDLTHLVTVVHRSNASAAAGSLAKRYTTHVPVKCNPVLDGDHYTFLRSECDRANGPHAWTCDSIFGAPGGLVLFHEDLGFCHTDALCVDSTTYNGRPLALCVSGGGYKTLPNADHHAASSVIASLLGNSASMDGHGWIEVIMTTADLSKGVTPLSMTITQQKSVVDPHTRRHTWEKIDSTSCSHCYAVNMHPIQPQTSRIAATISVDKGFLGAKVFIDHS